MARLIPGFIDEQSPPGEFAVFCRLKGGPADWTVLHALDLAPWNKRRRTEIDFLVIVPDTGILCLEVKSQRDIHFDGERWHPGSITRSPFRQALDARAAFYRRLRDALPTLGHVPVVHACVFPCSVTDVVDGFCARPHELMDERAFRALDTDRALCDDLRRRMQASIAEDPQIRALSAPLAPAMVDRIVELCLPVRLRRPEARDEVDRQAADAERLLREQQRPVLRLAALNRGVIVSGAAGTGKTLIAMELATREARRGQRVALLCFNRLIGSWMQERVTQIAEALPTLVVGRAFRTLADLTDITIPANPPRAYWSGALLDAVEERLTDPDFRASATFDYLVIDEAQDLLARPRLWHCLLQFLDGGLEHGRFALLGDFAHQALTDAAVVEASVAALSGMPGVARWHLAENCRNYQCVGTAAVQLSGLGPTVYDGYLRTGGTPDDVAVRPYATDAEQDEQLAQCLRELRTNGYRDGEITVLSCCDPARSAATRLAASGHRLVPIGVAASGRTAFTSVHAFKGMESRAVILTDVVVGEADFHRHLLYTAMTRSTGPVRLLCHRNCVSTLHGWLMEVLS